MPQPQHPVTDSPRRAWAVAAALCTLVPLLAGLSGDPTSAWLSTGDGLLEHKLYWCERVAAGQWPLWFPSALLGLPHAALQQTGDFSPYNLLPLCFGQVLGFNLLLLLPMSVAGLGMMAMLAARWRRDPLPAAAARHAPWIALCAGLGIALGSFIAPHRHHLALAASASLLTWVAWAIESRRWVWAGSLTALTILCGNPQQLLIGAPWLLWRFCAAMRDHLRDRRELLWLLLGAAAGLLLLLPQLLATLEYLPITARRGLDYFTFAGGSLPYWHLPILLAPFLWGGGETLAGALEPYHGLSFQIEFLQLPGFLLVAMATVGLLHGRGRTGRLVLAGLGIFALLAIMGDRTPFGWLLYHVPGANLFRSTGRWVLLLDFATLELAVLGLVAACCRPRLAYAWLGYLGGLLLLMSPALFATRWWAWRLKLPDAALEPWQMLSVFVQLTVTATAALTMAARALLAPLRRISLPILVAILAAVELSFLGVRLFRTSVEPSLAADRPGATAAADQTRLLLVAERLFAPGHRFLRHPPGIFTPHDERLANIYQPLAPRRLRDLLGIEVWGMCEDRVVEQRPDLLWRFGIGRVLCIDDPDLRAPWTAAQQAEPMVGRRKTLRGGPREKPAIATFPLQLPPGEGAVLEVRLAPEQRPDAPLELAFADAAADAPRAAGVVRFLPGDADVLTPWLVVAPATAARRGHLEMRYAGSVPITATAVHRTPLHIAPADETDRHWLPRPPRQFDLRIDATAPPGQTRARFVRALRRAASREAIERALRTGIPPLPADTAFAHDGADTARTSELRTLEVEVDAPERMVLRAATSGGGWIVANDMWMPGWTVTVDGEAKTPLVVDGWLRGVEVPAGEVEVEWRYLPTWFRVWPWSWLGWLLLCALGWRVGHRQATAD